MRLAVTPVLCALVACTAPQPQDLLCGAGEIADGELCVPERCGTGPFGPNRDLEAVFAAPAPLGAADGDGTLDSPLERVDEAIDVAFQLGHRVVALAGGTFSESISFGRTGAGARLVGRCSELTILRADPPGAVITIHADGVQLTGLTVTEGNPGIAVLPSAGDDAARLAASDIVLTGNRFAGLVVSGSGEVEADLRDSRISFVEPREPATDSHGLLAEGGGALVLVDVELVGNVGFGVTARGSGSSANLDDVRVLDTASFPDGRPGAALRAAEGGGLLGRGVTVEGTHGIGIWSTDPGSLLDLTTASLRGMEPASEGGFGEAVRVDMGGRMALSDVSVRESRGVGVLAEGDGSQLIVDTASVDGGFAMDSRRGSVAVLARAGATVSARDLVLEAGPGPGLVIEDATVVECTECIIQDRAFAGAVVTQGATLRWSQGSIRTTSTSDDLGGGVGILALGSAASPPVLELVEASLSDHAGPCLLVQDEATVLLTGSSIERCGDGGTTLPRAGLMARDGSFPWSGTVGAPEARGLWIRNSLFRDLGGDGVLLHAASGTLDSNVFEDIGETELRTQACAGVPDPELVGPQPNGNACTGAVREVGASVTYPAP